MGTVRSRVVLGVGAWLLGVTLATAGSLYAVDQLDNSLLAVNSRQMSVKMVNSELAHEHVQRARPVRATRKAGRPRESSGQRAHKHSSAKPRVSPSQSATPTPTSSPAAGVWLSSADGGADAVCLPGGAYLQYWTPQPGFEVDDVSRGPAAVASVVFRDDAGGIVMQISCSAGVPTKRLTPAGPDH